MPTRRVKKLKSDILKALMKVENPDKTWTIRIDAIVEIAQEFRGSVFGPAARRQQK